MTEVEKQEFDAEQPRVLEPVHVEMIHPAVFPDDIPTAPTWKASPNTTTAPDAHTPPNTHTLPNTPNTHTPPNTPNACTPPEPVVVEVAPYYTEESEEEYEEESPPVTSMEIAYISAFVFSTISSVHLMYHPNLCLSSLCISMISALAFIGAPEWIYNPSVFALIPIVPKWPIGTVLFLADLLEYMPYKSIYRSFVCVIVSMGMYTLDAPMEYIIATCACMLPPRTGRIFTAAVVFQIYIFAQLEPEYWINMTNIFIDAVYNLTHSPNYDEMRPYTHI